MVADLFRHLHRGFHPQNTSALDSRVEFLVAQATACFFDE
jgi:hypothetical protein